MLVSGRIAKEGVLVEICLVVEFHLNWEFVVGVPLSKVSVASSVSAVALSELIKKSCEVVPAIDVSAAERVVKLPVSP